MLVFWNNKLWDLDMSFTIYQGLREECPEAEVDLLESTPSMYKEKKRVPIGETNDYSIVRNQMALGVN